jgi:hypothetical protein
MSSNQYTFLVIVMHYITNDWKLVVQLFQFQFANANNCIEELLIDFWEFLGKDTGENLAEAVWCTMELYGLQGQVHSHLYQVRVSFSSDTRSLQSNVTMPLITIP